MDNPTVSINIVVLNGGKYIRHCLESVLAQTYPHELIEINILDNGSIDDTKKVIQDLEFKISDLGFAKFNFVESKLNLGMWGGQEELLHQSQGKYIVFLSVDVILEKDFILNAVRTLNTNPKLGAVQGKIYQFNIVGLSSNSYVLSPKIIDSCGFKIFRSRRVVNIGHGETDTGQYNKACSIFGVEGAVPVFKKEALESIRISIDGPPEDGQFPTEIADHDLFWYGEDLDVAWRLRMAGWEQYYEPSVLAWHDRQTTKRISGGLTNFIAIRRAIPLQKRRLEWRNVRCTIIKNDYIINVLKDLIYILPREITMTGYLLIFEIAVFLELFSLLKLIPRMIRKRKTIMKQAKVGPSEIHAYFS